jgi:hypothetical protein
MKKLNRDTPEWDQEWANLVQLTEILKQAPDDANLKAALKESAEKLGVIVPIAANCSVVR